MVRSDLGIRRIERSLCFSGASFGAWSFPRSCGGSMESGGGLMDDGNGRKAGGTGRSVCFLSLLLYISSYTNGILLWRAFCDILVIFCGSYLTACPFARIMDFIANDCSGVCVHAIHRCFRDLQGWSHRIVETGERIDLSKGIEGQVNGEMSEQLM